MWISMHITVCVCVFVFVFDAYVVKDSEVLTYRAVGLDLGRPAKIESSSVESISNEAAPAQTSIFHPEGTSQWFLGASGRVRERR